MSKFPPSVPLPESVNQTRLERRTLMMRHARRGIILRGVIIVLELWGFVFLNSSALLLDALSSLIDIASSLFLIFCIRFADRPPDRNHPFGHGRFEPIAGLQLALLLVVIGAGMLIQQVTAISTAPEGKVIHAYTWLIPLGAVVLLEIAYRRLRKTAKEQNSPALSAEAVHYRIDGINSLFATIALGLAAFYPQHSAFWDHLGAVVIALLMIGIGAYAARNNLNQLLDRTPPKAFFERVSASALRVPGVLCTEKVRIQMYGPDAHIGLDIEVDPHLSVELAHELTQKVRAEIQKDWPAVRDVIVHVEPYYPDDH
ncbi:MAG: cation diffusion facilitator family transporter [Chlamydiota bacterium]